MTHADPEVVARLRRDREVLKALVRVLAAESRLHGGAAAIPPEGYAILERTEREFREGTPPLATSEGPITAEDLDRLDALRGAASPGRLRKGAVDKERVFLPWEGAIEGPTGERVLFRLNVGFSFEADAAYLEAAWNAVPRLVRALREERDEAEDLAAAARSLVDSLGEYVRQSMHAGREWSHGIAAIEAALLTRARRRGRLDPPAGTVATAWRRFALAIVACERAYADHDLDGHRGAAMERRRAHEELVRIDPENAPPLSEDP